MNDIDFPSGLPPRRPLPPEIRDRLRGRLRAEDRRSRLRTPLAAAAAVAVLAAGAVIVGQSVNGTPADFHAGTAPPSTTPAATTVPLIPPPPAKSPDARSADDLDRCGTVAERSPRSREFAARSAWEPVFTVTKDDHRITAFRESGGKPGFCDVTASTATVSDPSAEPMSLGLSDPAGRTYALYVSDSGVLAGVVPGSVMLTSEITDTHGHARITATMQKNGLFVMDLGDLADGDLIRTTVLDADGNGVDSGEITYTKATARPPGATGTAE